MATEYGWDELVFDGEPLKSWLQGFLSTSADVIDFMANILELQAAALRLLADIVALFETPLDAAIFQIFLELLDMLIAMLHGRFHALFIMPINGRDKFGPAGFVERVNVTYGDIGDPARPIIDDFDGNSTIEGGAITDAGSGVVDVSDWRGFVDGTYTKVSASSVDLSGLPNGFYIIAVEDDAFISKSLGVIPSAPSADFSSEPPPPDELLDYLTEVTAFIAQIGDRFNAAKFSDVSNLTVDFPYLSFVFVVDGLVSLPLDARLYTPTVAMLTLYFRETNILKLAQMIMGLGLFFKQRIDQFMSLAEALDNYVPREADVDFDPGRRRASRPPDWWSPTISFFVELENVLRQFTVQVSPPSGNAAYLELVAEFLEEQAAFLHGLADRLNEMADLLEAAVFTAARFWTPLSYGGTDFLQRLLTATVPQLTNQMGNEETGYTAEELETEFYSIGLVLVGDVLSIPTMALIGGVDLTGGTGQLPDLEPNIVTIEGNDVEVVDP